MIGRRIIFSLSFLFALNCSPALANNWTLMALKDGLCAIKSTDSHGSNMFILGNSSRMELILYNKKWKSIQDGKDYELDVVMDDKRWTLSLGGLALQSGDVLLDGAYSPDDSVAFLKDFTLKNRLVIRYKGAELGNFSLNGSMKAYYQLLACNEASNPSDPFRSPANKSDPFRQ